jgi:hypothetical protein
MPKLFLENGEPRTLFLAALPEGGTQSFLVAIPLKSGQGANPGMI